MENSQGEEKDSTNSNPPDYVQEVRNFRRESMLSSEIQEEHKKKALMKCKDLHDKLMDCYESKYFCGTAEKEFWDCYRNERGFKKSKVTAWAYNFYHGVAGQDNDKKESE